MFITAGALLHLLTEYGYVLFFFASFIEGPVASVLGGFLTAQGIFNVYVVFILVVLGDLIGDITFYYLGYLSTRNNRLIHLFRLKDDQVQLFKEKIHRNLGKTIVVAKYTQTSIIALTAAGASRVSFTWFLAYCLLSSLPKSLALILLGYFFGYAYTIIESDLRLYSIIAIGLVIALIVLLVTARKTKEDS